MGEAPPPIASLARTVARGLRRRCPRCGDRGLFRAYLKLNEACPYCGADFTRAETADVAPYLTVFVIGVIATPLAFALTMQFGGLSGAGAAALVAAIVALALAILPRIKGMLAALLWRARREM